MQITALPVISRIIENLVNIEYLNTSVSETGNCRKINEYSNYPNNSNPRNQLVVHSIISGGFHGA
jgi:hypothetical protein